LGQVIDALLVARVRVIHLIAVGIKNFCAFMIIILLVCSSFSIVFSYFFRSGVWLGLSSKNLSRSFVFALAFSLVSRS
jgi:hypothetical protein